MPRKAIADSSVDSGSERDGVHLTSGDMARLLHVDLKTIHNWVNQGHMKGRRTKGRHLRFDRVEIVAFMRRYGYPIPDAVGAAKPRVVLDGKKGEFGVAQRALRRGAEVQLLDSLFRCALEVAAGEQEILVVNLDRREPKQVVALLGALADRAETRGVAVVGISARAATRTRFLRNGGSLALAPNHEAELRTVARWLTGSIDLLPEKIETPPGA